MHFDAERQKQFERDGFVIIEDVLRSASLEELRERVANAQRERANTRNAVTSSGRIGELLRSDGVLALAAEILRGEPVLTRAIIFDKRPGANWSVGWHQDVTIAVARRLALPGFSAWSMKEGVPHVQPPAKILERMVTIRLHLDDCREDNGPLQVLPGSHLGGRLEDEAISDWSKRTVVTCAVNQGGALVMRPLLLHRSAAAKVASHRRVLHLEFGGGKLPDGLEWNVL